MLDRKTIQQAQQGGNFSTNIQVNGQYYERELVKDLGVVADIFKYVLGKIAERNYKSRKRIDVDKKITINFAEDKWDFIRRLLVDAYLKMDIVEDIMKEYDTEIQKDIHSDIYFRYNTINNEESDQLKVFNLLCQEYTPTGKDHDPQYTCLVRAYVLFFFEDCTWGKLTASELAESS